jgi:NodT family efflux transporter outer membrane factor (OMF) lipoprotein
MTTAPILPRRLTIALAASVAACTVGPDYERPSAPVPASYKEDGWKIGEPRDAVDRGAWWSIYQDPLLDALEKQIDISNQNIKFAEAAYRASRAVVAQATAGYFPTVSVSASVQQSKSGQGGGTTATSAAGFTRTTNVGSQTFYNLAANASWAPDLWGRIRRTVESDVASAQVSAADLASARLTAQAELATDYFNLRAADELKRILDASTVAFTQSLDITRNQYRAGVANAADVAQAKAQLETTQAQAIATGVQRAQFEHAIAVLLGKPPAEFSILPGPLATDVPVAPAGVPSTLLERRPDIAAAERQMAAANAQIGVAVAAYYPDLTLTASYGYSGLTLGKLLQASNSLWSVGGQLAETVFDAGLRGAQVDQARAIYDQSVATYRQTVLTGFQQVEDELASLRILEQQAPVQAGAVEDAREAERIFLNQYKAGTVAFTTVIIAQTARLADEQTALTIQQNRLNASVTLIQALGGGWDTSQLPIDAQIESDEPTKQAARSN